jgi:3-oxoacyl-(acyl-carrier-protein) synthase
MALFAQYALAAAQEAIEDAGLQHMSDEEKEQVVCLHSYYNLIHFANRQKGRKSWLWNRQSRRHSLHHSSL